MPEPQADGGPRIPAVLAFLGPLGLYAFTAARTVQGGDSAEFGLLGMQGGVAHPPGYPLYTIIVRLFGLLPIDPPFLRVSLSSAVCGAAAVFVLYRVGWRLTRNAWASLGAALAFALTPIQWRLAGVPEVFALHALLVALAMLCTIRLSQATPERRGREAALLGLVAGLGLANHLTIVLCAPLFLGAVVHGFRTDGRQAGLRSLAIMAAMTLVGMLPYLLLFPWSHADPAKALVWGRTGTLPGFIHHVLRREYGTFSLHNDKAHETFSTVYIVRAGRALVVDYAYVFFLAGVAGVALSLRARQAAGMVLLACLFLAGVAFPSLISFPETDLTVEVAERFFLLPLVLFVPFVAWGLAAVLDRYASLRFVLPLALAMGAATGWQQACWRQDTILQQYVVATTQHLPPNAVVMGTGDNLFGAMEWRRLVLRVRPDILYIDPYSLRGSWYYERIRAQLGEVPLPYDGAETHIADLGNLLARYRPTFYLPALVPDVKGQVNVESRGLLFQVVPPNGRPQGTDEQRALLERDTAALGGPFPEPTDAWNEQLVKSVLTLWVRLSDMYSVAGRTADADAAARRALDIAPPSQVERWTAER